MLIWEADANLMLFKDVETPSSEQPVVGEDRQEIFMNIIEKQGAVTRLATAIQNRMLKDGWDDLRGSVGWGTAAWSHWGPASWIEGHKPVPRQCLAFYFIHGKPLTGQN